MTSTQWLVCLCALVGFVGLLNWHWSTRGLLMCIFHIAAWKNTCRLCYLSERAFRKTQCCLPMHIFSASATRARLNGSQPLGPDFLRWHSVIRRCGFDYRSFWTIVYVQCVFAELISGEKKIVNWLGFIPWTWSAGSTCRKTSVALYSRWAEHGESSSPSEAAEPFFCCTNFAIFLTCMVKRSAVHELRKSGIWLAACFTATCVTWRILFEIEATVSMCQPVTLGVTCYNGQFRKQKYCIVCTCRLPARHKIFKLV